jgi:citrate lyase subunit beta / citryl-CoA lyase
VTTLTTPTPMEGVAPYAWTHAESAFTWLFVPGDRPERFDKAAGSGADAVIIDLEDAVAPAMKPIARRSALDYVAKKPAYVRINGTDTSFFADDLDAIASAGEGLRGVVLPKSERAEQFAELDRRLPDGAVVIALVETPAGILGAWEIATAPRVTRLAFGSADFMLDTEIEDDQQGLLLARSTLVLAARAAGLGGPIDGITTSLDNPEMVTRDAENGRRLGFAGKLCIHPRQVGPAARGFAPSAADYSWAQRVIEAAAASNGAAVRVDGEMIDKPRLARARSIAERHRTLAAVIGNLDT